MAYFRVEPTLLESNTEMLDLSPADYITSECTEYLIEAEKKNFARAGTENRIMQKLIE